jgi:TRAP transporter 4TM/12TM fusion protein
LPGRDSEPTVLSPFHLISMRARSGVIRAYVFSLALFIGALEIFYILNFQGTLAQFLIALGIKSTVKYMRIIYIDTHIIEALIMAGLLGVGFLVLPAKRPSMKLEGKALEAYMNKYIRRIPLYDVALSILGLVIFVYVAYVAKLVIASEGSLPESIRPVAIPVAVVAFILVLELARRAVGPWFLLIVLGFLFYYLDYNRFDIRYWVENMIYWKSGLFNTPFFIMVIYVFAFLFFGTFLERIGIGEYITRLMLSLFGKKPGGPAKVAIVSSGLMGMLSGSSVANVFTTGTFTIPLMKRSGFPPEVAGAVEASASTGGQIMPPIMGAAAFIMAAFLSRPYYDIVIAGFLPAFIYFASLYYFVDLEAKRRGLRGLGESELPPRGPLLRKLYLFLPIILLTLLLVIRLAPSNAVVASLGLALVVAAWAMEGVPLSIKVAYTLAFPIIAGVALAVGMKTLAAVYFSGIFFLLASIALIATRSLKSLGWAILESVEESVRNGIPVFMAAALAGVIQGSITGTGLSGYLGQKFIEIAHGNLYLLLIFAGVISILVGMGVPTTANYVITSLLSAAAIATAASQLLSVPMKTALLAAHMFVFYYGILADVTPPVALAAFAGATVARADFWKTAVNATRMAFAKYVLPFIFVVQPGMLILPIIEGGATLASLAWGVVATIGVIVSASAGFAGYLGGHIRSRILRVILALVGIAAITTNPYTVAAAYALSVAVYLLARSGKA